jgi:DNA gyrase subunit A
MRCEESVGSGSECDLVIVVKSANFTFNTTVRAINPLPRRRAEGMAGIKLAEQARVICAAVLAEQNIQDATVVTVARNGDALLGADASSAKLSSLGEFPQKGRATGGVRAQRFLKGETELACAWVGAGAPQALARDGSPCELPTSLSKRDASGTLVEGIPERIGAQIS